MQSRFIDTIYTNWSINISFTIRHEVLQYDYYPRIKTSTYSRGEFSRKSSILKMIIALIIEDFRGVLHKRILVLPFVFI